MRTPFTEANPARFPPAILSRIQASAVPPRAILGRMAANGDPKQVMAQLTAGFEEFKGDHRAQVAAISADYNALVQRLAAWEITGGPSAAGSHPSDPSYSRPFSQWFRSGRGEDEIHQANAAGDRARVLASMNTGDGQNGGFLTPIEWDRSVSTKLRPISPMRRLANVVSTSVAGYKTCWSTGLWGSGWVGEVADRPNTSTPNLAEVRFMAGELYANPSVTQILLDDAGFNIEQWLSDELAETFALQEGVAFISGSGVNKPQGLLTYIDVDGQTPKHPGGNLLIRPSGTAAGITGDALIDLVFALPARYRQNARWLMAGTTAATIRRLKDGQGNYLWHSDYQAGQPANLLGFPVEIDENMPVVAAGNLPIAFGDFKRGYTINDRMGIRVLRDPYTVKGFVQFYTTRRIGGGVSDPNAIQLMKVGT